MLRDSYLNGMGSDMFLKILKNSGLILISCVVTLLVVELIVRLFIPQDKMITWIEMHEEGFVMNQQGASSFQEHLDFKVDYQFSKQRLRGNEPSDGKVRILTLGDSFTFGLLLPEEHTYVHSLQQKADSLAVDSIQFLNGAVGGSGLADWPGWLESFGKELKPDYVIYFQNNDDINRALSKNLLIYDESAPDSLIKSQRWKPNEFMFSLGRKSWYRWLQAHSELMNGVVKVLWRNLYHKDITSNFDPEKTSVPIPPLDSFNQGSDYPNKLGNQILVEMNKWCLANNCKLLIGTTGFFNGKDISDYDKAFYKWISESEWSRNGVYNDITPCVAKAAHNDFNSITIKEDTHPNKDGAAIISDCTWKWLEPILKEGKN